MWIVKPSPFPPAPTSSPVDRAANAIYAVRRGIVELVGEQGEKTCYRPGELFSYQDITWRELSHPQ